MFRCVVMDVDRIRTLLHSVASVDGGDGVALVSVDEHSGASIFEPLHLLTLTADTARSLRLPPRHDPDLPRPDTPEGLVSVLRPAGLSASRLSELLVAMCTSDMEFRTPSSPWSSAAAGRAIEQTMDALGPYASWWTNCDFSFAESWENGWPDVWAFNPVTRHTSSLALAGVGTDIIVTFLTFHDG